MDEKAMNVALVKAMDMIRVKVPRDPDLAADALVRVWVRLQQPGQWVSWPLVAHAIWDARKGLPVKGQCRTGAHSDPFRDLAINNLYRDPPAREPSPAVIVERMEGVGIVARLAATETERCVVDGLLDGSTLEEMAKTARVKRRSVDRAKVRLRKRCRKAYPSLIGY